MNRSSHFPSRLLCGLAVILLMTMSAATVWGAIDSAKVTGNWSVTTNWSTGALPGTSDTAYIADGVTCTINQNVTVGSLIIGGGGAGATVNFDDVATKRLVTITNDLTINTNSSLLARVSTANWDTLYLSGNLNNNGTFSAIRTTGSTNTIGLAVMFTNTAGDQFIYSSAHTATLTQFGKVYLSKGSRSNIVHDSLNTNIGNPAGSTHTARPATLFVLGLTGSATGYGTWEQDAGTLNAVTSTFSPGPSTANAANNTHTGLNIMGSGSLLDTVSGSFYLEVLTNINTTGSITLNSTGGNFAFGDTATISNGTIYDYEGTFGFPYLGGANYTNTPVVTMHGGQIFLSPYGTYSTSNSTFHQLSVYNQGTLNMDGGTITIVSPEPYPRTTGHDINIAATATLNITGGTINLGDGVDAHTSPLGFVVVDSAANGLYNLVAQGGASGRQGTLGSNLTVNSLTVTGGSTWYDSSYTLTVTGNISNSGTTTNNTGGEIKLAGGSGSHTLSGNGSYSNMELNDVNGASLSGSPTMAGTLTLTAGTFSVGANTLTLQSPLAGTLANFTAGAASSLVISGSASGITIPAGVSSLNNLTLNNASGSTLQGPLSINGLLTVTSGQLVATSPNSIDLSSAGALSEAGNGNIVLGTVTVTRTVSGANSSIKGARSPLSYQTFGNIGFDIDPAGGTSPGTTTITRLTGTAQGFADQSIKRYYNVNAATSTGLNASVVLHYDNSANELNGNTESGLALWRSHDNGATWSSVGGADDQIAHTVTATGVTDLSRWTASTVSMVPSTSNQSDIIAGGLTIPSTISSYATTQAAEVPVFSFIVRDGGASGDTDHVPTIFTGITLRQGFKNTAAKWTQYLQGAELFDGATSLGTATIGDSTLTFPSTDTVADDGQKQFTLKVWLKTSLPAGADNKVLEFKISQDTDVSTSVYGSTMAPGGSTVIGDPGTGVAVVAARLHFTGTFSQTVAGHLFTASVAAADTNGNIDADFVDTVHVAVNTGSGVLSGTIPKHAVAGTASFTDLTIAGSGTMTLIATSGTLTSDVSNSFFVIGPTTYRVANTGLASMNWDSTGTWVVESGTTLYGFPAFRTDSVILDNKYHPGNYTVVGGVHKRDTCGQLTIGYPGNANQITLLVPTWADSSNRRLVIGDSLPANYDLVIAGGGLLDLEARWASSYPIDLAGYHSPDSVWVRTGGRLYWASAGYQTIFFNLNRVEDGDYGTVELDVPSNFSDFNWGSSYVLPNFVLSNTHNAPTYYPYGSGAGIIKGNFIINPGVVDSLDLGVSSAAVVYGNIVNNGQTVLNNSQLVMAGSNQTITGSVPLRLKAGIAVSDSLGVTSSINLNVEGGSVQTNGTITSGSVNLPAKGTLTMNGGTTMYLNPAGSMNEGTNPVSGTISATRTISTSGDPMGNIGFDVASAAVAPGVTTVVRQNGTALSGNGHSSIKRYYDVNPAIDNALGATVDFAYGPAELNGITETNLVLSKSTDGGTSWTGKAGSINTSLHKITATAVQSLSRWTAADVNAPLYITHTVVERKFADLDGNPATTGDQSPKKWKLYLYADSVTAGTLVGSGNPNSGVLTTANLASGTYIAVEEDSLAWLHLGLHQHGTSLTNTLKVNASRYDTISFTDASANSVDTIDFINQAVSNLTVRKFRSLSGNPASLDARKAWGLTVYKGSVAPGNIMATGNVDSLTAGGLQGGLYIASEADSGATWKRVNGNHGLNDTMTLVAGQAVVDTFVNFKPNTITVSGFTDADGFFLTAGDRTAHAWYFEVRQNDGSGALVSFGSGTTLTVPNLGDGTYYISEADSSNWIHLGNVVNATATPTNANNVSVSVANGQTTAVSFVNAPPVYSAKFRSFLPNLIPVDVDNKGKTGKYVVPGKPDKAQFVVGVNNITDSANGLHMEFADAIDTGFHLTTVPASVVSTTDSKLKKWDFTFSSNLANPESVYVYGYAWAKKATKVSGYYFKKNGTAVSKAKKDAVAICILREPMPNRINGLFEAFNYGGFNATGGLVVGVNKKAGADSSKIYGWFQSLKYTDVLKSLDDKGTFHTQNGRPFDVFTGGKQITGQQKSLSPNKQNNSLLASMIALKLNITLSALGVTTPGFGELVYDSRSGDPLDGKMVKEIAAYIDTAMMGTVTPVTVNKKTTYTHQYDAPALYPHLDSIVASINGAFEGTVDTTRFFDSLRYAGTAELIAVPFLHADPNSIPARIIPMAPLASQNLPMAYTLYQNYPNPFNPTTTIQFDLPEASIVTLKVYNILGQEVATLLSRQQLSDGTQTVQFNAARYASGVYFYRLSTEKLTNADDGTTSGRAFISTKKMVLIK